MEEIDVGTSHKEGVKKLSDDAEVYKKFPSWMIYFSKKDKKIIFDATEYHPGALHVTKHDLEELLEKIK
jgi:hypothetical protein